MGGTPQFVGRDDARYATLTRGFNQRWVGSPQYVAMCTEPADVEAAVQDAVNGGLRMTVRSGGHCYEDFAYGNVDGMIIDLSGMTGVSYDPANRWYVVEAGATLWDVYTRLCRQYGVTIPGGSCYSVGAGGHVIGGGYGLLSRLYGLTVDHLAGVEVVCVDSQGNASIRTGLRDSSDPEEQLLWWAHAGGGGGNFGVVTRLFFGDLPPSPTETLLVSEAWDWDDPTTSFSDIVSSFTSWFVDGGPPDSLFSILHLTRAPAPQIVMTTQVVGTDTALLRDFRAAVTPKGAPSVPQLAPVGYHAVATPSTDMQVMPWLFVTQALNGSGSPQRGKYKSAYMIDGFTDGQLDVMYSWLRTQPADDTTTSLLQIDSYGGQVNAVASDATAVPQRSSALKLQYQTYWQYEDDDDENLAWIRGFYDGMYGPAGPRPDGHVDGCYVNYPDVDLDDWQYLYYKDNYPRLQQAKAAFDPLNLFNHQQSVELP